MAGKRAWASAFLGGSRTPTLPIKTRQRTLPVKALQDLIALTRVAIGRWGCPLCGEYHELEFHSYPRRWSSGSDGVRRRIRVVAILCRGVRGTGQPYTRRILPEHLIPRSPLWSKRLVELLEGDLGSGTTEAACAALGCVDPRTARKHIRALRQAVDAKLSVLAELSASAPGSAPAFPPGTKPFVLLSLLWDCFLMTAQELSGTMAAAILTPLLWLGPGFESFRHFNRSCIPIPGSP